MSDSDGIYSLWILSCCLNGDVETLFSQYNINKK